MIRPTARIVRIILIFAGFAISALEAMAQQDTPEEIVGVEVRRQGYDCNNPRQAQRDSKRSTPNETVWDLTCDEGVYRVTLQPNLGTAKISILRRREEEK